MLSKDSLRKITKAYPRVSPDSRIGDAFPELSKYIVVEKDGKIYEALCPICCSEKIEGNAKLDNYLVMCDKGHISICFNLLMGEELGQTPLAGEKKLD